MRLHKTQARWYAVVALTLAGVGLTACAAPGGGGTAAGTYCPDPGAAPAEPDTRTSRSRVTSPSGAGTWQAPEALLTEFETAYPNVTVKLETIGYPDILPKLTTALQAGTGAPDIAFLQDHDAPAFWDLPLADLTDCMAAQTENFPDYKIKNVTRPDGTTQAVPWESGPVQLLYRKDIFEQYGIDPTSLVTWDDFIAAGEKLVADSNGAVHMYMSNITPPPSNLEGVSPDFRALMQQNGGNLWDAEGNPTFDDPKAIEALELLKEFRDAGITLNDAASDQAMYDTMINGTVATYLAPTWWTYFPKTFAPETAGLWGGIPLPAFEEGGARSTNVGGTSLIIPSQSKNGAAAWAFLNFWLLRPESRLVSYENGGYLFENIYKPVADDPIFQEPDEFVGGDKWLANAASSRRRSPG